ncbi:MAG: endonuclease/exonuclease/phosphatase family protein [Bacteroidota bacterium]
MQKISLLSCLLFFLFSCDNLEEPATPDLSVTPRIAFYNVENLFDTVDDRSNPRDNEFLPDSEKAWTPERYATKIDHIARVIAGMQLPTFVGLSEVENEQVVRDLADNRQLRDADYGLVHYDSPDFRGIDNAFMYCRKSFSVLFSEAIEINFPSDIDNTGSTTRDILYVEGVQNSGDTLHFFINHWPSRSGGTTASEPRRVYVAEQLRAIVDDLLRRQPQAQVVIMGDFNDETDDFSIAQTLGAQTDKTTLRPDELYNCFAQLDAAGQGSYNFRGDLNMLDQIIVSGNLTDATGQRVVRPQIYNPDYLTFVHNSYGRSPNRTYGGNEYYGGYSDHYAVFVELEQ